MAAVLPPSGGLPGGEDPFAETLYQLGEQFSSVTGQPNPVPQPAS